MTFDEFLDKCNAYSLQRPVVAVYDAFRKQRELNLMLGLQSNVEIGGRSGFIFNTSIMDKNYKPITSMKEVPEQLRKLHRQYLHYQQAEQVLDRLGI